MWAEKWVPILDRQHEQQGTFLGKSGALTGVELD